METKMLATKLISVKSVTMDPATTEVTFKFPDVSVTAKSVLLVEGHTDVEYVANVNGKVVEITEDEYIGLVNKWELVEFIQNEVEELGKIPEQTYFTTGKKLKSIGEILGYEK